MTNILFLAILTFKSKISAHSILKTTKGEYLLNQIECDLPSSNQGIFVTRLTKGGCCNPLPRFSKPNPYEIDFGINS